MFFIDGADHRRNLSVYVKLELKIEENMFPVKSLFTFLSLPHIHPCHVSLLHVFAFRPSYFLCELILLLLNITSSYMSPQNYPWNIGYFNCLINVANGKYKLKRVVSYLKCPLTCLAVNSSVSRLAVTNISVNLVNTRRSV